MRAIPLPVSKIPNVFKGITFKAGSKRFRPVEVREEEEPGKTYTRSTVGDRDSLAQICAASQFRDFINLGQKRRKLVSIYRLIEDSVAREVVKKDIDPRYQEEMVEVAKSFYERYLKKAAEAL